MRLLTCLPEALSYSISSLSSRKSASLTASKIVREIFGGIIGRELPTTAIFLSQAFSLRGAAERVSLNFCEAMSNRGERDFESVFGIMKRMCSWASLRSRHSCTDICCERSVPPAVLCL